MSGETTKEMLDEATGDNVPDLVFDGIHDILDELEVRN